MRFLFGLEYIAQRHVNVRNLRFLRNSVLLTNNEFMDGLGLHVHIRTKIEGGYSFIEATAVKIGDDVFEVLGGDNVHTYWLNGKLHVDR